MPRGAGRKQSNPKKLAKSKSNAAPDTRAKEEKHERTSKLTKRSINEDEMGMFFEPKVKMETMDKDLKDFLESEFMVAFVQTVANLLAFTNDIFKGEKTWTLGNEDEIENEEVIAGMKLGFMFVVSISGGDESAILLRLAQCDTRFTNMFSFDYVNEKGYLDEVFTCIWDTMHTMLWQLSRYTSLEFSCCKPTFMNPFRLMSTFEGDSTHVLEWTRLAVFTKLLSKDAVKSFFHSQMLVHLGMRKILESNISRKLKAGEEADDNELGNILYCKENIYYVKNRDSELLEENTPGFTFASKTILTSFEMQVTKDDDYRIVQEMISEGIKEEEEKRCEAGMAAGASHEDTIPVDSSMTPELESFLGQFTSREELQEMKRIFQQDSTHCTYVFGTQRLGFFPCKTAKEAGDPVHAFMPDFAEVVEFCAKYARTVLNEYSVTINQVPMPASSDSGPAKGAASVSKNSTRIVFTDSGFVWIEYECIENPSAAGTGAVYVIKKRVDVTDNVQTEKATAKTAAKKNPNRAPKSEQEAGSTESMQELATMAVHHVLRKQARAFRVDKRDIPSALSAIVGLSSELSAEDRTKVKDLLSD